ncbi:MAG: twin-arginine translocation signal domain-containing protein, partial [Hyphomicrobiales bacterium]
MTSEATKTRANRRNFLKVAGLAGAGAIAMPQVSRAQTVTW